MRGFHSIPYLPRGRIEVIEFCGGSCDDGSVHGSFSPVCGGSTAGVAGGGTGRDGGVLWRGNRRARLGQGRRHPVVHELRQGWAAVRAQQGARRSAEGRRARRLGAGGEGRDGCGPPGGTHGTGAAARAAEAQAPSRGRTGGGDGGSYSADGAQGQAWMNAASWQHTRGSRRNGRGPGRAVMLGNMEEATAAG
jgi:hypothetical protein